MALANVTIINASAGGRHELGDPALAAPSIPWLQRVLDLTDPNMLDRGEWISFSAAFKQAGWTLADDATLFNIWSTWCARYADNDPGENLKQWNSIRNTEVGWPALQRRVPGVIVERAVQPDAATGLQVPTGAAQTPLQGQSGATPALSADAVCEPPPLDCSSEMLTAVEQKQYFQGCVLIGPENRIIDGKGQLLDTGAFNATFGGKRFVFNADGKTTDEAWKAATRGTQFTVPKVDGTTFRTDIATSEITSDELGRRYVNTYIPARIERMAGDVSPFLRHIAVLIPNPNDQRILLDYLAHNAQYPGHKIPWAPVIQSTQGAGKNVIKHVMTHVIGDNYTYPVNPKELAAGGGKFNDWMYRKLLLIADEIKTDDKRDMVEVLKPMISETSLEMQGKGRDQRKADNVANWLFFTNWKDAIPVNKNDRRFAIFYSAIQSAQDAFDRNMNDDYFKYIYDAWLGHRTHKAGLRIVADYLLSYPIERGSIPMRAPNTSSMAEAIIESRGWLEQLIAEAVDDQRNGFRGGWISTAAVASLLRNQRKDAKTRTIGDAIEALGYHRIGQAGRGYLLDDLLNPNRRGRLWNINPLANIANYGRDQNYE